MAFKGKTKNETKKPRKKDWIPLTTAGKVEKSRGPKMDILI